MDYYRETVQRVLEQLAEKQEHYKEGTEEHKAYGDMIQAIVDNCVGWSNRQ